jgi:CheY-like chemotaxis protein
MMPFKQKKILLVDDDEEEFYILKLALDLAKIDYYCTWANGLEQATQLIKELQPDFVFIDINMPRYDGINCLKKLKELDALRNSTFVMYSTYISDEDHDKALELGASHCIHKPENIRVLLKQLTGLFNDKAHHA